MRKILALVLIFAMLPSVAAFAKKDKDPYKYEIEGTDLQPTTSTDVVVKIWNYGKKEQATSDLCLQSAIEALLFKGYSQVEGTTDSKPAIVKDGREAHADYFKKFFESGDYKRYVRFSNNGNPDPQDIIKLNSKQYKFKVGMYVQVNYNALKKRMEEDGIIKSKKKLFDDVY